MAPSTDSSLALIILSAGRSTRMGESKALMRFGNWTTLELLVRTGAAAGIGRIVTVIGHRAEEIRAAHSFTGIGVNYSWAMNRAQESEQIESLKAGLQALEGEFLDAFFFLPVDYPLVTRADFTALIGAHRKHPGPENLFIPVFGEHRGHPVLCRAAMRETILALPAGKTARDLLAEEGVVPVEVQNPGILEDMDTRDDYRRLRDLFRQRGAVGEPGASRNRIPSAGTTPSPGDSQSRLRGM